jgi:hypothetical protein
MKMRENKQTFFALFSSNEELLRLLYYKPTNFNDNPLDPSKDNILDLPEEEKWEIINDVIKKTDKTSDLDTEQKCRLLFYSGVRDSTDNYLLASQDIIFDILVHIDAFDLVDDRLDWICDKVNDLISNEKVTGIGKAMFVHGNNIVAPKEYVGYRLIYNIGSGKK